MNESHYSRTSAAPLKPMQPCTVGQGPGCMGSSTCTAAPGCDLIKQNCSTQCSVAPNTQSFLSVHTIKK